MCILKLQNKSNYLNHLEPTTLFEQYYILKHSHNNKCKIKYMITFMVKK
jgi:hypothetical protein